MATVVACFRLLGITRCRYAHTRMERAEHKAHQKVTESLAIWNALGSQTPLRVSIRPCLALAKGKLPNRPTNPASDHGVIAVAKRAETAIQHPQELWIHKNVGHRHERCRPRTSVRSVEPRCLTRKRSSSGVDDEHRDCGALIETRRTEEPKKRKPGSTEIDHNESIMRNVVLW